MEQNVEVKSGWSDERVETVMGKLLIVGVLIAGLVMLYGGAYYLFLYGSTMPHYRVFRGEPSDLRKLSSILKDAIALRSRGLIQLGVILLVATPIARVAFSVFAFARQRDGMYVTLTLIVLGLLLYSFIGGLYHP
jgi:uncharacterized membrane protein